MAGGMELHFFRALNFQISEPEIWQKSPFQRNLRGFLVNFGLWKIFFRTLENGHSIRHQSIPPLSASRFMGHCTIIAQYVAKWGIAQMCLCQTKYQGGGISPFWGSPKNLFLGWPRTTLGCSPPLDARELLTRRIPQPINSWGFPELRVAIRVGSAKEPSTKGVLSSGISRLRNSSGQGFPGIQGWWASKGGSWPARFSGYF